MIPVELTERPLLDKAARLLAAASEGPEAVRIAHAYTATMLVMPELIAEVRRLRAGLESLHIPHHPSCPIPLAAPWYASCDCGAAEHNARVAALLAGDT